MIVITKCRRLVGNATNYVFCDFTHPPPAYGSNKLAYGALSAKVVWAGAHSYVGVSYNKTTQNKPTSLPTFLSMLENWNRHIAYVNVLFIQKMYISLFLSKARFMQDFSTQVRHVLMPEMSLFSPHGCIRQKLSRINGFFHLLSFYAWSHNSFPSFIQLMGHRIVQQAYQYNRIECTFTDCPRHHSAKYHVVSWQYLAAALKHRPQEPLFFFCRILIFFFMNSCHNQQNTAALID